MKWNEIETTDQEYLIEWLNHDPDYNDKRRLAKLFSDGNFRAWNCPECDTLCLVGNPTDWGHFQGVRQSETYGELCEDCTKFYLRLKEFAGD